MRCNITVFLFFVLLVSTGGEAVKASLHHPKNSQIETFENDLQKLQEESSHKKKIILEDKEFQDFVAEVKSRLPFQSPEALRKASVGELYIFVSFSLGEKALLNLAHEAGRFGATLVLRGFRDGSYGKTAQALQTIILKTGQGFIIDPELFALFGVTAVPTYVLAKPFSLTAAERIQTPLYDRLQGHVSVGYALETFAKEGDLKREAQVLLEKGVPSDQLASRLLGERPEGRRK